MGVRTLDEKYLQRIKRIVLKNADEKHKLLVIISIEDMMRIIE